MTDLSSLKRVVIGRPRASRELKHQLLPKWMALPVFSSDPMSSVAYATEEMMLVLALAGASYFWLVRPLSLAVAALLIIVVISYRQTVHAYPRGGGAYIVSRENLGEIAGLTAASSILIDYVLTVAVSTAAGVAAITSAAPSLKPYDVPIALGFVVLVTLANLRGVKEAGGLFAVPTYTFVVTIYVLIVVGLFRCVGGCPQAPPPTELITAEAGLTLFLILRAFSSGATALTGVEAISDGVSAFRYPQSRNAASTLAIMGVIAVTMFLGISFLAIAVGAHAFEGMERTVVAQIALAVFGLGPAFYLVQIVTAAILILAANTAYADFPRLASILAGDRFLPRQFLSRGDRLVFSNGILALAGLAGVLIILFDAEVSHLIQLYVVGVFTSFTLSQTGMVLRTLRRKDPGWRRVAIISSIGALTTGVVLIVVAITKFLGGAWIVIASIPVLVTVMHRIHRHYVDVSLDLRAGVAEPEEARRTNMIVLLDRIDESVARALSYARGVAPRSLSAIAISPHPEQIESEWARLSHNVPLTVVRHAVKGSGLDEMVRAVTEFDRAHPDEFTSAIVTERLSHSMVEALGRHRAAVQLKARLVGAGIVVTNVTGPGGEAPQAVQEPVEHHVIVLVSGVHKATTRAIAYAEGLSATSVRALSINLEVEASNFLLQEWDDWGVRIPLEVVDSPYRSIGDSVKAYVRDFAPDGRRTVVTCVVPEFVLPKKVHRPLHNQSALIIKASLVLEPGVVVTSVPYRVGAREKVG